MKKLYFSALGAMSFILVCCSGSSGTSSLDLLTIVSPENEQVLYTESVEVVISLSENADPATFQAWLNGNDISDRFTVGDRQLRALVGVDDGLLVNTEEITTERDDKGVWFHPPVQQLQNPSCHV